MSIDTDTLIALTEERYGSRVPAPAVRADDGGVIQTLLGHRSVRAFTAQPIDDRTVDTLITAAQSASTSSNLQSWSVIVVRDTAHKDRVATVAGDQQFIRDAPVFLVFVADWARGTDVARNVGEPSEGVAFLDSTFVGVIDAAIAAQNAVVAAESLGLGAVYVGAVRNDARALAELLELPHGSFAVVGVALGHESPAHPASVKPRLPQAVVRHDEVYRAADPADIAVYDETLRDFYEDFGRGRGWTESVVRRVRSKDALHGRQSLRSTLEDRGLSSR